MTGVDFPRVSLNQAWWDPGRGELSLQTVGQNEAVEGTPTTFRISRVGDPTRWEVNGSTEAAGPAPGHRRPARSDVPCRGTVILNGPANLTVRQQAPPWGLRQPLES